MARRKANRAPSIEIRGARENNLRSIDLDLPRHRLVAVTGVSGSGKSSLLYQTLAAESAARHEALTTTSTRKAFAQRPVVAEIRGLPFCETVAQKQVHRSPRSTVSTLSGLLAILRRLVIEHGEIRCDCGRAVPPASAETLVRYVVDEHKGWHIEVGAVVARSDTSTMRAALSALRDQGFSRILVQSEPGTPFAERELRKIDALPSRAPKTVVAILDVLAVTTRSRKALEEVLSEAVTVGGHGVLLRVGATPDELEVGLDTGVERPCPGCGALHVVPTSRLLTFNGAPETSARCAACAGLGTVTTIHEDAVVTDRRRSLDDGCLNLVRERGSYKHLGIREDVLRGLCVEHGRTFQQAFGSLPAVLRDEILHGIGARRVQPVDATGRKSGPKVRYHGIVPSLAKLAATDGPGAAYARTFVAATTCSFCRGARFDPARVSAYRYGGLRFAEMLTRDAASLAAELGKVPPRSDGEARVLTEALATLRALDQAGVGYVGLERATSTLSGGELQRIKIAGSLHTGLTHACYILDEPSLGLHAVDTDGLIATLFDLRDAGNTVLVADHDPAFRKVADAIVELGPGSGQDGGRVVVAGAAGVRRKTSSKQLARSRRSAPGRLRILGCSANNLRSIDVEVPLGGLVCLSGVSGSGKSSFAHGVLVPAVRDYLADGRTHGPTWTHLHGAERVRAVSRVGQDAIGTSVTSVLATYLDLYTPLREAFAATDLAVVRGYTPSHFSFNRPEGRCPTCAGRGVEADASAGSARPAICSTCGGRRFTDAILDVRLEGRSIAEILDLDVTAALAVLGGVEAFDRVLPLLERFGLGHLSLGRPTPTLSGGEAQRLKLVEALSHLGPGPSGHLFVLDEPTAGLHADNVRALLRAFDEFLALGENTLVVIEHDLEVLAVADHLLDFGPGPGSNGGDLVYAGDPRGAADVASSRTGEALGRRGAPARIGRKPKDPDDVGGHEVVDEVPAAVEAMAERFAGRVHGDGDADGYHEASPLVPTYVLDRSGSYPLSRLTVLENLRAAGWLYEALAAVVTWPVSAETTLGARADVVAAMPVEAPWQIAFSPITAELERRCATRTSLAAAFRQAGARGFDRVIDGTGHVHDLVCFLDAGIAGADLFDTRVLAGACDDADARRLAEVAFDAGGGWFSVHAGVDRRHRVLTFGERPVDVRRKQVGPRRCTAGQFDRHGVGACPFCQGAGVLDRVDVDLLVADRERTPLVPGFLTGAFDALLRPVRSRVSAALSFLATEGVCDVVSARRRWTAEDWTVLLRGYPWATFPIPGRSGDRAVDRHAWPGLEMLALERLHLSREKSWRARVEASRSAETCSACGGTGLGWAAVHGRLADHSIAKWMTDATLGELDEALGASSMSRADHDRIFRGLAKSGLDSVRVGTPAKELAPAERDAIGALAVERLGHAEATYVIHGEAGITPVGDCMVLHVREMPRAPRN